MCEGSGEECSPLLQISCQKNPPSWGRSERKFCFAVVKLKPLSVSQNGNEEQQERFLREWLDCCVTEGGVLVAMQKSSRRRNHPLVTQMVEKWLDRYRQIRPCASLSDGEEEDDEDEWVVRSQNWTLCVWERTLTSTFIFTFSPGSCNNACDLWDGDRAATSCTCLISAPMKAHSSLILPSCMQVSPHLWWIILSLPK